MYGARFDAVWLQCGLWPGGAPCATQVKQNGVHFNGAHFKVLFLVYIYIYFFFLYLKIDFISFFLFPFHYLPLSLPLSIYSFTVDFISPRSLTEIVESVFLWGLKGKEQPDKKGGTKKKEQEWNKIIHLQKKKVEEEELME